jgi:hypothetical protein
VTWRGTGLGGVDTSALASALHRNYRLVGEIRGHGVYLRRGVSRPAP